MSVMVEMPPPGLTRDQGRLVAQHRTSLLHVAARLAERNGRAWTDIMLLVASRQSRVGMAILQAFEGTTISRDIVVVPGRASELAAWIARIASLGPVVDCTIGGAGVATIVIDGDDQMALLRLR